MNTATADWSQLPHQPILFFRLKTDFDRRDLKRAYGKLIRRFKPETHPQEFQKIRRAYEELENQVRYGIKQKAIASQAKAWNATVASAPKKSDPTGSQASSATGLGVTELAINRPQATYSRLTQSKTKSPQDFFVLAVLSDLMPSDESNAFLRWLLLGMKQHPTDAGLQQLLREYLSSEVDHKSATRVLQVCSKSLPGDVFYRLTEPLWDHVLRETKFKVFAQLLVLCEKNIKHKDMQSRVTYYLHILRPAIWKADKAWTSRVLAFLESNGTQLDPAAEQELEFLSLVQAYIQNDCDEANASPLRKQLDAMLRSYCQDDWNTTVAKVAQVQDRLARNSHEMIEAFPITTDERYFRLLSLCAMVVSDVAEQTAADFGSSTERQSERLAFAALSDLRDSIVPVIHKLNWQQYRSYGIPFVLLVIAPPIAVFAGAVSGTVMVLATLVWIILALIGYYMWLKPKVLDPRVQRKADELLTNAYQRQWRSRLFRYVQSCGEPPQDAIVKLQHAAHDTGDGEWMNVVLSFINGDAGLIMFGQAQMFLS